MGAEYKNLGLTAPVGFDQQTVLPKAILLAVLASKPADGLAPKLRLGTLTEGDWVEAEDTVGGLEDIAEEFRIEEQPLRRYEGLSER
jgi:hypothetical protein